MALILILTTPVTTLAPKGYQVIQHLNATANLPTSVKGPMDNPALKKIMAKAKKMGASALLNFTCQTNGREIGCTATALKHNFTLPKTNTFKHVTSFLFGQNFYMNPALFPKNQQVGKPISIIFYVHPNNYRTVAGQSTAKSKKWWGLKKSTKTIIKPTIPALCVDSLYFMHTMTNMAHAKGLVNYNCYASLSNLPGYVQVNASANVF